MPSLLLIAVATIGIAIVSHGYSDITNPDTNWWEWPMMSWAVGLLGGIAVVSSCLYVSGATIYAACGWMFPNAFATATVWAGGVATTIWQFYLTDPTGTNQQFLMAIVPMLMRAATGGLTYILSTAGLAMQYVSWCLYTRVQTNKVYNKLSASTLVTTAVATYFLACYQMAETKTFWLFNWYFAFYIFRHLKTFHLCDDLMREYTYVDELLFFVRAALTLLSIVSRNNTLQQVTMNTESSVGFGGVVQVKFFANARMKVTKQPVSGEITLNAELEDDGDPNASVVLGGVAKNGVWWGKLPNALCTFITQFKENSILACPLIILEPLWHKYGFHPVKWAWFPVCNDVWGERECIGILTTFMSAFDTPSFFDMSNSSLLIIPSLIILGVGGLTIAWTFAAMLYPLKVKIWEDGLRDLDTTNKNSYVMKAMRVAHTVTWIDKVEYAIFLGLLLLCSPFTLALVMFFSVVDVCKNATHLVRVSKNGEISLEVAHDVEMRLKLNGTGPSVGVYAKAPTSGPQTNAYELRNKLHDVWLHVRGFSFEQKMCTFIGACFVAYKQYTMTPYAIK